MRYFGFQFLMLTSALVGLSVNSASAQFYATRPGATYFFNQNVMPNFGGFGNNYSYNFGFRINHVNPVTGQRFSFNWTEGAFNAPPGYFGPSVFRNNYGYMSGGYGALNPYSGYGAAWQSSGSQGSSYRPYTSTEKGAAVNNQWGYETGDTKPAGKLTNVELNLLLDPNEDLLASGQIHNELIAQIRRLEKSHKADSPLLPPGLVDQIDFVGGPAASVLTILKGGKPTFPEAMLSDGNLAIKMDLEAALLPVSEAYLSNQGVNPADANKLAAAVATAKKKLADTIRNLPLNDGLALTRFLNGLEGVAKSAKDAKLNGVYVAAWRSVGPSIAELLKHMEKYQLQVGPAQTTDLEAYSTLHRGLASYYLALTAAAKK